MPRIYCEKYYESNTSKKKKKFTTIFTIVELVNLLLISTTSIGVKSFVKFFVSIDFLKIKFLSNSC